MEDTPMEPDPFPYEEVFQALPPLGSAEYLEHIRNAPAEQLPPEVLVRAFRQLPPNAEAARATLDRLFRRTGERWEYLGPLVARARRMRLNPHEEYEDLIHDTLTIILKALPTPRGHFAARAWHSFCRVEVSNAWRKPHGRRGERLEHRADAPPEGEGAKETPDPVAGLSYSPPWHGTLEENQVERIEAIVEQVVAEIDDKFVRGVAKAMWFSNEQRPKVSGSGGSHKVPPLTTRFPKKSRFQIHSAIRQANGQLAAALLADPSLEWTPGLQAMLERLRDS